MASLIREEFSTILTRSGKSIYGNVLVTITHVRVTSDLSLARINLSIFNTNDKEAVIEALKQHTQELRKELGDRMRHHLRKIPVLEFYNDDTLDYVFRMEEVFKNLKKD